MATGGIPVFAPIPGQDPAVTIPNTVSLQSDILLHTSSHSGGLPMAILIIPPECLHLKNTC